MEKHEITGSTQLPEEIIHHIQSFLTGKEATRTTILSKSWYNAWLTLPNLDFDACDISTPSTFAEFVNKTLQRYEELNLTIRKFKLYTSDGIQATEWTKKAVKLGATDLHIEVSPEFVLPREVLQSESLVRLSLVLGRINLHKVNCCRLKCLNLCDVRINIWDIIWMCPLIEELVLSSSRSNGSYRYSVLKPSGLVVNDFHKLKVLSFDHVEIDECLFSDLSSKFPCLKELTLKGCTGYQKIQISSDSLERVVLKEGDYSRLSRVECDVPRIHRFEFTSSFIPSLSFKTTSAEWESHISISDTVNSSWFVELRKFLLELSSSKIYLDLLIFPDDAYKYASHMIGLPKPPIVERLDLELIAQSSVQSAVLEELFWSCRPNFIRCYANKYRVGKRICKTLIKEGHAMYDLEEVNVEISGHTAWTWSRNLLTNTPRALEFAYSGWIRCDTDVCIQLKWG